MKRLLNVQSKYKIMFLSFALLLIASRFIAKPYRISGDCMEPAIMDGQLYFSNSISPYIRHYQINDIIVFKHEGIEWISRIVALENDIIEISEGKVLVNGTIERTMINRNWTGWRYGTYALEQPFHVPSKHVYVLSDNLSAQHDDSRVFGPIAYNSIIGLIW